MAEANVYVSHDFFKEISIEAQQLRLVSQYLQTYIDRAKVRGCRMGDDQLLTILEHMESFIRSLNDSGDRLEKICARVFGAS